MKTAICTMAIGEQFQHYARMMVLSLRRWGGYDGDIFTFGDTPTKGLESEAEFRKQDPVTVHGHPFMEPDVYMGKAAMCKVLLDDGYDRVIYTDADCLAIRSIAPLFEKAATVVMNKDRNLDTPVGESEWHNGCMAPPEREAAKHAPINAGTFGGHGSFFAKMIEAWQLLYEAAAWRGKPKRSRDMAALNLWAMYHKKDWQYFDDYQVHCLSRDVPDPMPSQTVMLHFTDQSLKKMGSTFDKLCSGEVTYATSDG
jgi:hypothetical protein